MLLVHTVRYRVYWLIRRVVMAVVMRLAGRRVGPVANRWTAHRSGICKGCLLVLLPTMIGTARRCLERDVDYKRKVEDQPPTSQSSRPDLHPKSISRCCCVLLSSCIYTGEVGAYCFESRSYTCTILPSSCRRYNIQYAGTTTHLRNRCLAPPCDSRFIRPLHPW